jgi:hypothetical protein
VVGTMLSRLSALEVVLLTMAGAEPDASRCVERCVPLTLVVCYQEVVVVCQH